ncbi:TYR [Mytilus coruscus]|uniref:TYR n=1 Tax=Mytilus coruscus TaxID=42192 RepID=A0A6J8D2X5_MYTCO|nr:TYR [Mytilus coruscus]
MTDITLSPMDPVFWLHHCFIDYLWEQFRECQTKLGINSETDYSSTTILEHMPNRRMDNLRPQKTNIQGLSNSFTKQIYRYAPAPTCRNNCGGAFNGFLFCDIRKQACVSRSRYEFIGLRGFRTVHNCTRQKKKGKRVTIPRVFMNFNQLLNQQAITSEIGSGQEWVSQIGDGMGAESQIENGMGASTQIGGGHGDVTQIGDGMGASTQIGGDMEMHHR